MPDAEYHNLPHISQSSLKVFLRNPLDYKHTFVERQPTASKTAAMDLGTLVHSLLLEPQETANRFVVLDLEDRPDPTKTINAIANRDWKRGMLEAAIGQGKCLVMRDIFGQAEDMRDACLQHTLARSFLLRQDFAVYTEQSIVWKHPESELNLKSQLDRMLVNPSAATCDILDYKTTSANNLADFGWSVRKFGYDTQAAFYEDAARCWLEEQYPDIPSMDWKIRVLFIPQKVSEPYQVLGVVQLDDVTLRAARERYVRALQELEGCLHTGVWGQEQQGVTVLQLSEPEAPTPDNLDLP